MTVCPLTLTDSHIMVGNGSNQAADVAMSGDATINDTGAVTVSIGLGKLSDCKTAYAPNYNVLVGSDVGWSSMTGIENTALGWGVLHNCTTGDLNTGVGEA